MPYNAKSVLAIVKCQRATIERKSVVQRFFPLLTKETTFCTLLQHGVFILEEYQEQAFQYASAIADMIDIKDGANACRWSSSSFPHKECLSGHSVGAGRRSAPRDDDCKDIDFGFDSKSDLC
jgi:hypothetical protein